MCGIVGYVGPGSAIDVLLGGLKRQEYRGYDSAGVAIIDDAGRVETRKRAGKLGVLVEDLADSAMGDGHTGIGHTRWATHGGPTDVNAHPHLGDEGKLALIHNGIIENFAQLKQEVLDAGGEFTSETDSEVAAARLVQKGCAFAYGGGYGSVVELAKLGGLKEAWPHCNMVKTAGKNGQEELKPFAEPFSFVVRTASTDLPAALNAFIQSHQYPLTPPPDLGCQTPPWVPPGAP